MVYRYTETKKESNAGDNTKPLTEKKFLRIFKNDIWKIKTKRSE